MDPIRVIMLPGAVLPAEPAYAALIHALGPDVDAVAKDLELYLGDAHPPDWSLDTEIDGVLREAGARGWRTFHLVGYSGGAAAALAFTATHPERLLSLALLEPAWAGNWDWSPAHTELWKQSGQLGALPPEHFLPAFMKLQVKPDVVLPPPRRRVPRRRGWPSAPPASRPSCRLSQRMSSAASALPASKSLCSSSSAAGAIRTISATQLPAWPRSSRTSGSRSSRTATTSIPRTGSSRNGCRAAARAVGAGRGRLASGTLRRALSAARWDLLLWLDAALRNALVPAGAARARRA